jgi:hypothetical protein
MTKPRLAAAVAVLVVPLTMTSCAPDDAEPALSDVVESPTAATAPTTPSSGPSESESPSTSPSTSAGEPTATLSVTEEARATMTPPQTGTAAAGTIDVASLLLPAARMGKLNAQWTWSAGNDFATEPANLTACHRVELEAIGAEDVAVREYTSRLDAGVRAHHLVAAFPDDVTARRAYAVLQSWRDSCQQRLEQRSGGDGGMKVTRPEPVSTRAQAASSYVVFQPNATGSARIDNVATSLAGTRVDLVVVKVEGDDFNYPRGRTPAAVGVRNAAERSG